jgi:hypothetical protein
LILAGVINVKVFSNLRIKNLRQLPMQSNNKYYWDGKVLRGPLEMDKPAELISRKDLGYAGNQFVDKVYELAQGAESMAHNAFNDHLSSLPTIKVSEQLQKALGSEGKMVVKGVDFCLLKTYSSNEMFLRGGDYDVVIAQTMEGEAQPEKTYPATAKELSDLWDAAVVRYENNQDCILGEHVFDEEGYRRDKQRYFQEKFGIDLNQ